MASKDEIKTLFVNELKNTPQYQMILNIKQLVLNEIATPNIQKRVVYNFERYVGYEEQDIIKLCSIVEFGFEIFINENYAEVYMNRFLE